MEYVRGVYTNKVELCLATQRSYDKNPLEPSSLAGIETWKAAQATSAAPTDFKSIAAGDLELVDGGLNANNPLGESLASRCFEFVALMLKFVQPILYQIVDLCCTLLGLIAEHGVALVNCFAKVGFARFAVLIELVAKVFDSTPEEQFCSQG